jgi:hypothetical protein
MKLARLFAASLLLGGCSTTNRSYLRDNLATLPSGDEINAESEVVQRFASPTWSRSMVAWRRKGPGERLLAVEGRGEMRVRDAGKVLDVKGELKDWHTLRGATPPSVRVSADGNRAWLVSQGQVIASFDYDSGTAIFGTTGQPAWATVGP